MIGIDSDFWLQIQDNKGTPRNLPHIYVTDLRRTDENYYEALSCAFEVLDRLTPLQRWQQLEGGMLYVYATPQDAVIALCVAVVKGRRRFIAVIRDMFSGGSEARSYMQTLLGDRYTNAARYLAQVL